MLAQLTMFLWLNWRCSFVTPVVEHWLEREIAQWVHHTNGGFVTELHNACVLSGLSFCISVQMLTFAKFMQVIRVFASPFAHLILFTMSLIL